MKRLANTSQPFQMKKVKMELMTVKQEIFDTMDEPIRILKHRGFKTVKEEVIEPENEPPHAFHYREKIRVKEEVREPETSEAVLPSHPQVVPMPPPMISENRGIEPQKWGYSQFYGDLTRGPTHHNSQNLQNQQQLQQYHKQLYHNQHQHPIHHQHQELYYYHQHQQHMHHHYQHQHQHQQSMRPPPPEHGTGANQFWGSADLWAQWEWEYQYATSRWWYRHQELNNWVPDIAIIHPSWFHV